MKPGFNPTRRNRNTGTSKRGYKKSNHFDIPAAWNNPRMWWATVRDHKIINREISGRSVRFVIENTKQNFIHACSVSDICHVLSRIPLSDWDGLFGFIFRQPTRKEQILAPVWGRLAYQANVGKLGKPDVYAGPAIVLEATNAEQILYWDKSLSKSAQDELERLREDGHKIEDRKKYLAIISDPSAIRTTQLHRTVLHEIGHWVEWQEKVTKPGLKSPTKLEELENIYFARPFAEREIFAHQYSIRMQKQLEAEGVFPFKQISDRDLVSIEKTVINSPSLEPLP